MTRGLWTVFAWLCTGSVGCANVCEAVASGSAVVSAPNASGRVTVKLSAPPPDPAHPAHVLAYLWSSTSGTIDASRSMNATLTCDTTGPVTISLRITDGVCEQSKALQVDCSVAKQPICQIGANCNAETPQAGASAAR